jgi:hypothetical protein
LTVGVGVEIKLRVEIAQGDAPGEGGSRGLSLDALLSSINAMLRSINASLGALRGIVRALRGAVRGV